MKLIIFFSIGTFLAPWSVLAKDSIHLKLGVVKKIPCEGRLYISSVGDDRLVRLEASPRELGCAVYLKPLGKIGVTNLILETSTGTVEKDVLVENH